MEVLFPVLYFSLENFSPKPLLLALVQTNASIPRGIHCARVCILPTWNYYSKLSFLHPTAFPQPVQSLVDHHSQDPKTWTISKVWSEKSLQNLSLQNCLYKTNAKEYPFSWLNTEPDITNSQGLNFYSQRPLKRSLKV